MDFQKIKKMINEAIRNEEYTENMVNKIINVARGNNKFLSIEEANEVCNFVKAYVNHVPMLLEKSIQQANRFGIEKEIGHMMKELDEYWKLEQDEIPDNLGLYGLLDDAYASMYWLQNLSWLCYNYYGRKLMNHDFAKSNEVVRNLLGTSIASRLEEKIKKSINDNMKDHDRSEIYKNIFKSGFTLVRHPDPYWKDFYHDFHVVNQLGIIGLV